MAESDGWLLLKDAPLDQYGHVWSPEWPDRTDPMGHVYDRQNGKRAVASTWRGVEFTHWHALPKPPTT